MLAVLLPPKVPEPVLDPNAPLPGLTKVELPKAEVCAGCGEPKVVLPKDDVGVVFVPKTDFGAEGCNLSRSRDFASD